MKRRQFKFTADQLVHLCVKQLKQIKDPIAFTKKKTLLEFAVSLAERYGASVKVFDELAVLSLVVEPVGGIYRAIALAPYVSPKMKEKIFTMMVSWSGINDIDSVFKFAANILKRDLMYVECDKIKLWFNQVPNKSDIVGRQKIVDYIEKKYPNRVEEVRKHYKGEDKFWNGMGQVL